MSPKPTVDSTVMVKYIALILSSGYVIFITIMLAIPAFRWVKRGRVDAAYLSGASLTAFVLIVVASGLAIVLPLLYGARRLERAEF